MMKGEVSRRFENPASGRKHEIKVRGITERGSAHPDTPWWGSPATANPAPPVQIDFITTGGVDAHGLIAIGRKEKMPMVGSHDGMFDARCGKPTKRSRQIIYDR